MDLLAFIQERNRIRDLKDAGQPAPWTEDPILQRYFISNIDCEDDKTTRWLKAHWREPHQEDPDLPFALAIFRRGINFPATAEALGFPAPWDPDHFLSVIRDRKTNRLPWCNPQAYKLVVGHKKKAGEFHGPQEEMLVHYVFNPLWEIKEQIRVRPEDTCQRYYERLSAVKWMGGWYAYRVVCDLMYTKWLRNAGDWQTFIVPGPGSVRGLNRVKGRPYNKNIQTGRKGQGDGALVQFAKGEREAWITELNQLRIELNLGLNAHVVGGALCEYDKWHRIKSGDGKVRIYSPAKASYHAAAH